MPGKVNPVIPEVVNQTGFLVIGLDFVMEPAITFAMFTSSTNRVASAAD